MNFADQTPQQIDEFLAENWYAQARQLARLLEAHDGIERAKKQGLAEDHYNYRLYVDIQAKARPELARLRDEAAPGEAEYARRKWSRFFLVAGNNGHIHPDMACFTCRPNTEYRWLPSVSGKTEAEAVDEYGSLLCTFCYPSAPVEWTDGSRVGRLDAEARAAKDAEKAEKARVKAEKAIANPDGSPLVIKLSTWTERPKTYIAARNLLLSMLDDAAYYEHAREAVRRELPTLLAALAHKTGEPEADILAAAVTKTVKKWNRDHGTNKLTEAGLNRWL